MKKVGLLLAVTILAAGAASAQGPSAPVFPPFGFDMSGPYFPAVTAGFLRIIPLRGPLRVREFVCVRWPRTGSPLRWRKPR